MDPLVDEMAVGRPAPALSGVVAHDEGVVEHAELRWPPGGGVMVGTKGAGQEPFADLGPGGAIYAVTDEPDALFARATAAGAEVVLGLKDEEYGSRGFTVRDPEGTLWSFGTYRGAAGGGDVTDAGGGR